MSQEHPKESQTYQAMINRVEEIIQNISESECDLDTMVEKVEEGFVLIKNLKERLNKTKDKIEKLQLNYEQKPSQLDNNEP